MPGGVPVSPPEPVIKPRNFNELRGFCFSGPSNADLQEVAGRFAHASRETPVLHRRYGYLSRRIAKSVLV
jgi:hypothetical protein